MGRKALKRKLGRNPSVAELEADRIVKAARRQREKDRKIWVSKALAWPAQQQRRVEKAFTAPVLVSPYLTPPVVVKQLTDTERRIVAGLEDQRAAVAYDPVKRESLDVQIARMKGLTRPGGM
jgi:hypothetical protein